MTDSSNSPVPTRIAIDSQESLPDLLGRLRTVPNRAVVLEIPDHSPILLTASEFRTLKEIADQSGITLTLRTDDRLRMQLATMFGLMKSTPVTSESEGWRPTPTALGTTRSFGTWRSEDETVEKNPAIDASRMPSTTGTRRRRLGQAAGEITTLDPDDLPLGDGAGALDYLDPRHTFWSARNIGRLVVVLLVAALIAGAAGWYYLPTVTVHATLKETPLTTEFVYSVAAPGASAPSDAAFTLPAEQGAATVPFTLSIPATGKQAIPLETATGSVTLRNPGKEAITVPEGARLANHADVGYFTTSQIEVPAATEDGAKPGETTVEIRAEKAGTGGNQPTGYLTGKIADLDVYFSNRDAAVEGGTDSETTVVSEADLTNLEAQLDVNLPRAAAVGWESTLPEGQSIVAQSVDPDVPEYTIDQKAGDESETVTMQGTVAVTGLIYNKADVEASSRQVAAQQMTTTTPEGFALQTSSIALGEPRVLAEAADSVQYQVTATGVAQAIFDQPAQDQLAKQITAKDWNVAMDTAQAVPALESVTFSHSPGWWPQGMPHAADRVTIDVDSSIRSIRSAPVATPAAETPAMTTPATPSAGDGS